jgi:hypothetical protein
MSAAQGHVKTSVAIDSTALASKRKIAPTQKLDVLEDNLAVLGHAVL